MRDMQRQHLSLLYDISELTALVAGSKDIDSFLQQVVRSVASHLNAEVGSIYLLDDRANELVLRATQGLNPESVGRIHMRVGEGLVGVTLERMAPVCEGTACDNPSFKYFEEAWEEPYRSLLSVPIARGIEKIGVLVVQHSEPDYFDAADVMALRAIATQLAGAIGSARLMMGLQQPLQPVGGSNLMVQLSLIKGEPTVSGFAHAPAALLAPEDPLLSDVPEHAFHASAKAAQRALQDTRDQLKQMQEQLVFRLPESAALIFEAHHMILKDPRFEGRILETIRQGRAAAEAVRQVARHFIERFDISTNPYIREKARDIEDLARRILFNLRMEKGPGRSPIDGHIVIAARLYPSDVLRLASEGVAGIILVGGGVTSHVAIMARSLKIPMIIAQHSGLLQVPDGTPIVLDADFGNIYLDPSEPVLQRFAGRSQITRSTAENAAAMQDRSFTADGRRIHLMANINLLWELDLAVSLKAEGVGLYRSEFPFIVRSVLPSEEEQRLVYARLFEKMPGRPVYMRVLDIGGDKILPYLNLPREANPELGLRSIRFLLRHREVFDQQLRAILRAGVQSERLGIMFPMISSLDEFEAARRAVHEVQAALAQEGLPHHPSPLIGSMIEIPSVLTVIDELAAEADFFSIGTNDFIQYMLAVDRTNENVAGIYQPFHPAILRSLAHIVQRIEPHQKPISVCGEVVYNTEFLYFLIGIGVRRLSVNPQFLPLVQQTLAALSTSRAQAYAEELLAASSLSRIETVRKQWRKERPVRSSLGLTPDGRKMNNGE